MQQSMQMLRAAKMHSHISQPPLDRVSLQWRGAVAVCGAYFAKTVCAKSSVFVSKSLDLKDFVCFSFMNVYIFCCNVFWTRSTLAALCRPVTIIGPTPLDLR